MTEVNLSQGFEAHTAKEVMDPDCPYADIRDMVGDTYQIMKDKDLESLPVVEDGRVVRVVTRSDLEVIRSVFADTPSQGGIIARLMGQSLSVVSEGQDLVSVGPDDSLKIVAKKMVQKSIHSIPVLNETSELLGIIHSRMLLKGLIA